MASPLGPKSMDKLKGVHPDLVRVVKRAILISEVDFIITEGVRSVAKQTQLVKAGASKTMNSRHLTGHAIDLAPVVNGEVRWDWPPFHLIAKAMKKAAEELNVAITWGGDWRTFKDGPHFELPW
jgi:peptidoglycan L-alanyl-D-glutamate endopeptidase CwlK